MIRFSCPSCMKVLKADDDATGRKTACPGCGQRLLVPPPFRAPANKTVLGKAVPEAASPVPRPPGGPAGVGADAPLVVVACPGCGRCMSLLPYELYLNIECAGCAARFVPADVLAGRTPTPPGQGGGPANPANPYESGGGYGFEGGGGSGPGPPVRGDRKHSGLGIAAFLIAVTVGGLDAILGLVVASNVAHSASRKPDPYQYRGGRAEEVKASMLAGGMAMVCLNCMSLPVCLIGVGLGVVALVVHRDANHLFTWIGLGGNGAVILGLGIFYVIGLLAAP